MTSLLFNSSVDKLLHLDGGVLFYGGTVLGSLLPDIDHPSSFIGRRSLGISHILNKLLGHRGLSHSLYAVFLISLTSLSPLPQNFSQGLTGGYLAHIIGDYFSKTGVPLFSPFSKRRFKFPLYRTGDMREGLILIASAFLLALLWL